MILYAGGKEAAQKVVDKVQKAPFKWKSLGVWHPFNSESFNAEQPQGRVPVLDSDYSSGFNGNYDVNYFACVVGVAPEAHSAKKIEAQEHLSTPNLERILQTVSKYVPKAKRKNLQRDLKQIYK